MYRHVAGIPTTRLLKTDAEGDTYVVLLFLQIFPYTACDVLVEVGSINRALSDLCNIAIVLICLSAV